MQTKRFYRDWTGQSGLINFEVVIFETDLSIFCDRMLKDEAQTIVYSLRKDISDYIDKNPSFKDSLKPLPDDADAPYIVKDMIEASRVAGVGPMAGVAGAIAEHAGIKLLNYSSEIIIENGGDIFLKSKNKKVLGVYAGSSPLSGKVRIRVDPKDAPMGICTSSGTVGHSMSFGIADAVTIISGSAILADCVATEACNLVKDKNDLQKSIKYAKSIDGINGILIIADDRLATWGEIELV
ncbi:MAG: UPF0280 family protein [Candidatus Omnitrophica bacterium]|nr:UPF0280 family protein [Candidatus Omnitrophota bacterium]